MKPIVIVAFKVHFIATERLRELSSLVVCLQPAPAVCSKRALSLRDQNVRFILCSNNIAVINHSIIPAVSIEVIRMHGHWYT